MGGGWVEVTGEQRWINEGQGRGKKAEERDANKKRRGGGEGGDKWNTNICIGRRLRPRNILECCL